jgi:CubicO group peptidase (beta-lactamase class C family)
MHLDDAIVHTCRPTCVSSRARQVTLLELADFTSGLPDDPLNLPRWLEMRAVDHDTVADGVFSAALARIRF